MDLARSQPDAIDHIGHDKRLWRRVYPPTGREGLVPVAFVFAHITKAKVDNTVKVLEEAGRRCWAPRRYDTYYREAITAKDYSQAVPVVFTTLKQLQEHGADATVWRRLGRTGDQTLAWPPRTPGTPAAVPPAGHRTAGAGGRPRPGAGQAPRLQGGPNRQNTRTKHLGRA
ncbi:hypothetical protein ACFYZ2_24925 [Streptomyces sviceus]|uniref:hypothetical protein n=1 Tax=Streptomyces sviceus TaxID=285530 RepID=UPI0036C71E7D